MNDVNKETKKRLASAEIEPTEPVMVIRAGAVAASIWRRQSPSGYGYYDFSVSRSWKSMSSAKTGYSKNFFSRHESEIAEVVAGASKWIREQEAALPQSEANSRAA